MQSQKKRLFQVEGLAKSFAESRCCARSLRYSKVADGPHRPFSSGKTVLFKCLLGLLRPDAGRLAIEGREQADLSSQEREALLARLGVAFQQNALFDSMTCWENVAFRLLQQGQCSRKEARARAIDLIASLGLRPQVADRYPAEISGGMQKRIALAVPHVRSRCPMLMPRRTV